MPRYKAIIAYDGTHFHGFQKQPNERTVQEEIEKTLARMNNGHSVTVLVQDEQMQGFMQWAK